MNQFSVGLVQLGFCTAKKLKLLMRTRDTLTLLVLDLQLFFHCSHKLAASDSIVASIINKQ